MKKWQQYMTAMVVGTLGAVYCANAQDSASTTTTTTTQQNTTSDFSLYRDHEFSIDLFGSGSINNETIMPVCRHGLYFPLPTILIS
jgi:hypothetical protein